MLFAFGNNAEANRPLIVKVSDESEPRIMFPLNVVIPSTFKYPDAVMLVEETLVAVIYPLALMLVEET